MRYIAPQVVSIADACLGGLYGRSALLIGPEEQRRSYASLLYAAGMKQVYQEETPTHVSPLLPSIHLLISMPKPLRKTPEGCVFPMLTAATVARGCDRRRTPLVIFDLACSNSVEELAGLLPAVCLYTPEDLRHILAKRQARQAS